MWAAALAVVLSPLIAFLAAEAYLSRQLQSHLQDNAAMVLDRIENAIDRALVSLKEAGARGMESCDGEAREALRVLAFESPVLKEIAVLSPQEEVRCNNIGSLVQVTPASSSFPTADPQLSLAAMVIRGPHGRGLRIIWRSSETAVFGGLIAAGLFVPTQLVRGADIGAGLDIEVGHGGRLVSMRGPGGEDGSPEARAEATSRRLPIRVVATASEGAWRRANASVVKATAVLALAFGMMIAAFIVASRHSADPIAEMRDALDKGEFVPHYQPILDIHSGRILGCEVLVRWRKPDGRLIPPGAFIGEAERSGFIFPLTLALMRQAVAELGPAYGVRPDLKCGFNLCAAHFRDERIVAEVEEVFAGSPIGLDQVLLEVTERDPLPDIDAARTIIARFQALGVRVALDDVGTGHGGMSYLLKLGVDVMKIDKLFIDALGEERQTTAIVDSLIDLAAQLKMDVVAEGVETFAQVEALRRRGVRSAQGYVFAPPLPGSSFVRLVEATEPPAAVKEPLRRSLRG